MKAFDRQPAPPFWAEYVHRFLDLLTRGDEPTGNKLHDWTEKGRSLAWWFHETARPAGERAVLQWFAPEEAIVRGERRLFVVVVPAWSVVTVRASHSDAATARSWGGFVTHDRTVWDDPPEFGCLRLSVDLDADTTLLIDGKTLSRGQRLAHRTVGVQAGPHELVALRCAAPGQCVVRFRETLPPAATTGTQNLCQDVALDLHQPRSVAIVRASAAPGCDDLPLSH